MGGHGPHAGPLRSVVVQAAGQLEAAAERDAPSGAAGPVVLRARPVGALPALLLAAEQVAVHQQLALALSARHERVTYTATPTLRAQAGSGSTAGSW